MNLADFYHKIRCVEAQIEEPHVVVVSLATSDGGKAGVRTEVTRGIAARLVVEGRARLASAEEAAEFRAEARAAQQAVEDAEAARRMQVTVVSTAELRALRQGKQRQ